MALLNNVPIPLGDPIARVRRQEFKGGPDPQEGLVTDVWQEYLSAQAALMEKFPARIFNVELRDQGAAIGALDITNGTLTAGLYRLTYYLRVVVNELGSTCQVVLDWQDRGVVRTHTSALVDGAVATNYASDTVLIYSDRIAPVRYAMAYTAIGSLLYDLDIIIEEVKA